jgi:hypothetical protein
MAINSVYFASVGTGDLPGRSDATGEDTRLFS